MSPRASTPVSNPTNGRQGLHGITCLAVDSDGCVIDSMTAKHTEVFTPCLIRQWALEAEADVAREVALDINLYSETRGLNRFAALARFFEEFPRRLDPARRARLKLPDVAPLREWVSQSGTLSQEKLMSEAGSSPGILKDALAWSMAVNAGVALLPPAQPFPAAVEALHDLAPYMEIRVVSSANQSALEREWKEAELAGLVSYLGGQEAGGKATQLRKAAADHGAGHVLMVGDAAGDRTAAEEAGVRFHRIRAGEENASWRELIRDLFHS